MKDREYVAAWVPAGETGVSPARAIDLAAGWLLERSRDLGAEPLLVLPEARTAKSGPEAIQRLANRYEWTTPRSRGGGTGRAVLAYVPDYKGMELAAECAAGAALAVVAHPTPPLIGWAMERRALDLTTGQPTPDTRTPAAIGYLEHLHQGGNNGWTTSFDKRLVPRILAEMRDAGVLDRDVVLGYMLARGHFASSLQNLAALLARLAAGRPR